MPFEQKVSRKVKSCQKENEKLQKDAEHLLAKPSRWFHFRAFL